MSSITSMEVALNSRYHERVKYYMQKAAIAVMSEDPQTSHHAERVIYANTILAGEADVRQYAIGTMTNPVLANTADPNAPDQGITDGDLEFTVNSEYNAFAGIAT